MVCIGTSVTTVESDLPAPRHCTLPIVGGRCGRRFTTHNVGEVALKLSPLKACHVHTRTAVQGDIVPRS